MKMNKNGVIPFFIAIGMEAAGTEPQVEEFAEVPPRDVAAEGEDIVLPDQQLQSAPEPEPESPSASEEMPSSKGDKYKQLHRLLLHPSTKMLGLALVGLLFAYVAANLVAPQKPTGFGVTDYYYLEEKREYVPVALLYCEETANPVALQWLTEERRNNDEARTLGDVRKHWRNIRCRWNERAAIDLDRTFTSYIKGSASLPEALGKLPRDWKAKYRPEVDHVFVDTRGEMHYRVLIQDVPRRSFRPALLSHEELVELLNVWYREVRRRLRGTKLEEIPCVCPQHLGIIGSGLFFTRTPTLLRHAPYNAGNWRILVGMQIDRLSGKSVNSSARLPYSEAIHAFPALVDYEIVDETVEGTLRIIKYPTDAFFDAYEPSVLVDEDGPLEEIDPYIAAEWDDEVLRACVLPLSRGDVAKATRISGRGQETSTKCLFHCQMLEEKLLSQIPSPEQAVPEEPEDGALVAQPSPPAATEPVRRRPRPRRNNNNNNNNNKRD